jgi:GAG-pre-integrase domain
LYAEHASSEIWHQRFGHPSSRVMKELESNVNVLFYDFYKINKICESCQLAKSHKLPFNNSVRKSTSSLELIHCDI